MTGGLYLPSYIPPPANSLNPSWRNLKYTTAAYEREQEVIALRSRAYKVMATSLQLFADRPSPQKRATLWSYGHGSAAGNSPPPKPGPSPRLRRRTKGLQHSRPSEVTGWDKVPPPAEQFAETQANILLELIHHQSEVHLQLLAREGIKSNGSGTVPEPPTMISGYALHVKSRQIKRGPPQIVVSPAEEQAESTVDTSEELEREHRPSVEESLGLAAASRFSIGSLKHCKKELKEKLDLYHINSEARYQLQLRAESHMRDKRHKHNNPRRDTG